MMSGDQSYMKNFLSFAIFLPLLINDLRGEIKEDEYEADGVEKDDEEKEEEDDEEEEVEEDDDDDNNDDDDDDVDIEKRESTTEALLL